MGHREIYTKREIPYFSQGNLLQCHFDGHKIHMDCLRENRAYGEWHLTGHSSHGTAPETKVGQSGH
jgi:hypothetical protein